MTAPPARRAQAEHGADRQADRRPSAGPGGCCAGIRGRGEPATARSSPSSCWPSWPSGRAAGGGRRTSWPSGLLARCTSAGLTSHELPPPEQIQCGVATLCCALAAFLTFGVAMLAQLATGWQWVAPRSASAAGGTIVMSVAAACLALIGLAAAVPVAWQAAVAAVGRRDSRLAAPGVLALACGAVLVGGARHFQNSWPGTGGTGAQHGLVPGRAGGVWLGVHPVGVVILGASGAAWHLPRRSAGLDGG